MNIVKELDGMKNIELDSLKDRVSISSYFLVGFALLVASVRNLFRINRQATIHSSSSRSNSHLNAAISH